MNQTLFCQKYKKEIKEERELKKCLCRFKHRGVCGICPNLIDLRTRKPLYEILFKNDTKERDFWETVNEKWLSLKKAIKEIEGRNLNVFQI